MQRVLRLLGAGGEEPEGRTAQVCLDTAAAALEALIVDRRFAREDAAELLAIDALTTYAFEYASQTATSARQLQDLADQGTRLLARATERV
jgi:hypothetical protein